MLIPHKNCAEAPRLNASRASRLLATSLVALAIAAPHGVAQDAPEPVAEEDQAARLNTVTVTARRKEESLQDVPVSVSAFSGEDLKERSIEDISTVSDFTPNLTFDTAGNAAATSALAQVFIRGIGQSDFLPTADPGVGIYIDGVYLGRTVGGVIRMSDVQRVEVLRGPQGTLFGRNTIGGAINIVANEPTDALEGSLSATIGDDNWYKIDGVFNAPVGENAAIRLSGQYNQRDGYFTSTFRPDIDFGNEDNYTLRGQFKWENEGFRLLLAGDVYSQEQEARPTVNIANIGGAGSLTDLYNQFSFPLYGEPPISAASLADRGDPFTGTVGGPSIDEADVWGLSATAEWDIGQNASLKSITAYREIDSRFASDNDGSFHTIAATDDQYNQDQFSQEFQFLGSTERMSWVGGLYYFEESSSDENTVSILPGLFDFLETLPTTLDCLAPPGVPVAPTCPAPTPGVPGGPGNPVNVGLDLELDTFGKIELTNYALYGEIDYILTDSLTLVLGGRLTEEEKDFSRSQFKRASGFAQLPLTTISDSWSSFTPRLGLNYQFENGSIVYANYSEGFKSGTFNGRSNSLGTLESVEPETVQTYEVGFKTDLADSRLRINGAAFYNDYQDIQLTSVIQDPLLGLQVFLINAAEAEVMGGELELLARPNVNWDFALGIGYADSEIASIDPAFTATTGVAQGNVLKKTPELSINASAQYSVPVSFGDLAFRLDYAWQDDIFHSDANVPTTFEEAYGLLNARIALRREDSGFEVALFGTNITDEVNFSTIFQTGGGQTTAIPNRGSSYGITLSKQF